MIRIVSAEKIRGERVIFKGLHHVIFNGVKVANARKTGDEGTWLVNPFPVRFSKKDQTEKRMTINEIKDLVNSGLIL